MKDNLIRFSCPGCKKRRKAPVAAVGKIGTCPYCSTRLIIPSSEGVVASALKSTPAGDNNENAHESMRPSTFSLEEAPPIPTALLHTSNEDIGLVNNGNLSNNSPYTLASMPPQDLNRFRGFMIMLSVVLLGLGVLGILVWTNPRNERAKPPQHALLKSKALPESATESKKKDEQDKATDEPSAKEPTPAPKEARPSPAPKEAQAEVEGVKVQEALRNAVSLQVPPSFRLGGQRDDFLDFRQQMRELASNEFAFKKAQNTVYRSTFDQRDQDDGLVVFFFQARNAIVQPGTYDFDNKRCSFALYLWCTYFKEGVGLGGKRLPETTDYCVLQTSIMIDADVAAKMRAAYEEETLSLTITYRLKRVIRNTWAANPHGGTIPAHNLALEVEVLRFE